MNALAPTPGRRVTPTARMVMSAQAIADDRAAWLAARLGGVGSSDVADCMEVGYKTPLHVYHGKRGELVDDVAGEPALWGTLHEETVAREWARRNRSVVRRVGLVAHVDEPWMMCTLDRRITECPLNRDEHEQCALEVKSRNAFAAARWKRAIPDDVLAQTLWQIAVSGYDHIHTAVLIGNADYRQTVVRRAGNEQLIEDITTVCRRMWRRIQDGDPPTPSGRPDALAELYGLLHPVRGGTAALEQTDAYERLLEYEDARLREKAAKDEKECAKAQLIALLGSHSLGAFGNDYAYGLRPTSRDNCDLDLLAERYPGAYAECVSTTAGLRLDIARAYRLTEALS